jgi:hypothetical protein
LTRRLNDYYYANPEACRISIQTQSLNPDSLFDHSTARFISTNIPPAPFLVPVVIEALGESEAYKEVTEVVPGEADLYCGRYVNQQGGLVLTGDSDLLVHDLGTEGSVCFFKDIDRQLDTNSSSLRGHVYYPARIAGRLSLPKSHGLRALAFEMIMDGHGTFRKLLGQAVTLKAVNTHKDQYVRFLGQYNSLPTRTAGSAEHGSGYPCEFMKVIRTLDPRISEYVIQYPSIAKCIGNVESAALLSTNSIHVFLPFLVDCPIRTTAWQASTSLRQLAYVMLKGILPESEQEYCVMEHRRQNNSSGKGYRLPNIPFSPGSCTSLTSLINRVHHKFSNLSVPDRWVAFAVCQQVEWSISASNVIVQEISTHQVQSNNHINCTWETLQFLAQVQGVFYSLRILQQITGLLISCGDKIPCLKEASLLHDQLMSLPPLSDVPNFICVMALIHKIEVEHMVQAGYEILGD